MVVLTCGTCLLVVRVMGDTQQVSFLVGEQSPFWPDKYKCPRCDGLALATTLDKAPPELLVSSGVIFLEAEELFAALNGLGLPEERKASKDVVEKLLKEQRVVRVGGENFPTTTRCRVDWLDLDDGTRLFFAAGGRGAVVYRVRRPHSYVEKTDGKSNT